MFPHGALLGSAVTPLRAISCPRAWPRRPSRACARAEHGAHRCCRWISSGDRANRRQCANATDDDNDGFVNDGCPAVAVPELPVVQCADALDDDSDTFLR